MCNSQNLNLKWGNKHDAEVDLKWTEEIHQIVNILTRKAKFVKTKAFFFFFLSFEVFEVCSLESLSFKSNFLNTDEETKEENRTNKLELHQDHKQLNVRMWGGHVRARRFGLRVNWEQQTLFVFLTHHRETSLTQLPSIVQESPGKREVTRWSSHSEAMLQASLDDVDWDMFRASSADVSEFTDVALSFVYMLTDQATETVTIRTFSNQKPWVDRTIRAAVNQRTAAYNAGLLSGNMSDYKASCYALRRAVRAAKLRYRERIESHFQLNDSRRMWQGLKTICSSGNNP